MGLVADSLIIVLDLLIGAIVFIQRVVLTPHIVPFSQRHLITRKVTLIVVADGRIRESLIDQLRHQEFQIALQAPGPWKIRLSILIYYSTYVILQSSCFMFMINFLLNIIYDFALLFFFFVHDIQDLLEFVQLSTLILANFSDSIIDFLL